MLELVPLSAFSERYRVERDGIAVAEFKLGWLREGGELAVEGVSYELRREGRMSGAFLLRHGGAVAARADKPSGLRRRFDVEHDGRRFEFVSAGFWTRGFELRRDGATVGRIIPRHAFTRRAAITFPADLPLPVTVFLAALAALMWKRDAAAASAG